MTHTGTLAVGVLVLAAGTYGLRLLGPWLRTRAELSPRLLTVSTAAVAVVLTALIATSTLVQGQHFAGAARVVGVTVGGLLAWRRAPFLVVVLAAAATTAALRAAGVP